MWTKSCSLTYLWQKHHSQAPRKRTLGHKVIFSHYPRRILGQEVIYSACTRYSNLTQGPVIQEYMSKSIQKLKPEGVFPSNNFQPSFIANIKFTKLNPFQTFSNLVTEISLITLYLLV